MRLPDKDPEALAVKIPKAAALTEAASARTPVMMLSITSMSFSTAHSIASTVTSVEPVQPNTRTLYRSASGATPGPIRQVLPEIVVALYVPVRWPAGVPTTPELDQTAGNGTRPADFAADVAELERLLATVAAERSGRLTGIVHPIFGAMSEAAWLRWAYLHADHHLRQFGA